jgi:hypothetical protein
MSSQVTYQAASITHILAAITHILAAITHILAAITHILAGRRLAYRLCSAAAKQCAPALNSSYKFQLFRGYAA